MRSGWLPALAFLLPWLAGCQGDGPICGSERLAEALERAYRGDTVRVGTCRLEGSFTVPEGVTLEGQGDGSVLAGGAEGPVVVLEADGAETVLRAVSIESDGPFGVYARGGGAARLEGVRVVATRGVGLGLEGLSTATLEDVSAAGPVTEENAESFDPRPSERDTAILGLFMVRVSDAELARVEVNGFAGFGAILAEGSTHWRWGNASKNLGCGLTVQGGSALLEELVLCDTFRGASLVPAYGGYFPDAEVETRDVEVCAAEGIGMLHLGGEADHTGLSAHGNDEGGLWAQAIRAFELRGAGSAIYDNRFVGLALLEPVGSVEIADASIEGTAEMLRFYAGAETVTSGDGIQLVRPAGAVDLAGIRLDGNERVGLLLDSPAQPSAITIADLLVDGVDDALGAIAQGADLPEGWDDGVSRLGATEANDAAHEGALQVAEGLDGADLPESTALVEHGIEGLLFDR